MANEEDESRRRRREREDEQDAAQEAKGSLKNIGLKSGAPAQAGGGTEKIDELIQRADPMIDQLNNLYSMFLSGAESIPPTERRKQLDQLMATLQMINKPTPSYQFKYSTLH